MANVQGLDEAQRRLEVYAAGLKSAAALAAQEIAVLLEGYAKANHPWTPRTGNTTNSIRGTVVEASDWIIHVVLSAGMDYDVYLELAHEGKWAWLWPAVVANHENIKAILRNRLGAVRT